MLQVPLQCWAGDPVSRAISCTPLVSAACHLGAGSFKHPPHEGPVVRLADQTPLDKLHDLSITTLSVHAYRLD